MQIGRKYAFPIAMCLNAAAFVLSVCVTASGGVSVWIQEPSADAHYLTVCQEESSPDKLKGDIPLPGEGCWAQESTRIRLKSGWNDAKGSATRVVTGRRCDHAVSIVPYDAGSERFSREVMGLLYSSAPPP